MSSERSLKTPPPIELNPSQTFDQDKIAQAKHNWSKARSVRGSMQNVYKIWADVPLTYSATNKKPNHD